MKAKAALLVFLIVFSASAMSIVLSPSIHQLAERVILNKTCFNIGTYSSGSIEPLGDPIDNPGGPTAK